MNALISVDPLTDLVWDVLARELSSMAWKEWPVSVVREAIEFYNADGLDAASESIIEAFRKKDMWTPENIPAIDGIIEMFAVMFHANMATMESKVQVEYDWSSNMAIVKTVPIVRRSDKFLDDLKADYHNAIERSDFVPERLRRAFDDILR